METFLAMIHLVVRHYRARIAAAIPFLHIMKRRRAKRNPQMSQITQMGTIRNMQTGFGNPFLTKFASQHCGPEIQAKRRDDSSAAICLAFEASAERGVICG